MLIKKILTTLLIIFICSCSSKKPEISTYKSQFAKNNRPRTYYNYEPYHIKHVKHYRLAVPVGTYKPYTVYNNDFADYNSYYVPPHMSGVVKDNYDPRYLDDYNKSKSDNKLLPTLTVLTLIVALVLGFAL